MAFENIQGFRVGPHRPMTDYRSTDKNNNGHYFTPLIVGQLKYLTIIVNDVNVKMNFYYRTEFNMTNERTRCAALSSVPWFCHRTK